MANHDELESARWDQILRDLSARLDEERPARYVVSDTTEEAHESSVAEGAAEERVDWIDRVAEEFRDLVPISVAQKRVAKEAAHRLESYALRRGNKHLRDLVDADQIELGVACLNYPVSVHHRIVRRGERPRVRIERVRMEALTSADLRVFAAEERRRAANEFAVRNDTCEKADRLADEVDAYAVATVGEWRDRRMQDLGTSEAAD